MISHDDMMGIVATEAAEAAAGSSPRAGSADDKAAALLQDRFGPKVRPLAYACHLPRIAAKAREFGYAIAVHGSLQRDLDLIAVPWSEEATDAEQLVQAICETSGAFILSGQDATPKPHGRLAYVLQMGAGLYIDLGVMPRVPNPPNNDSATAVARSGELTAVHPDSPAFTSKPLDAAAAERPKATGQNADGDSRSSSLQ